MAAPQPRERLRISPRSAAVAVALFGLTLLGMRILASSQRVIGWALAAAAVAGLLHPYVAVLSKKLPRGVAVLAVGAATLGTVAAISWAMVDGVVREYHEIQRVAPERARAVEERGRFAEAARDARLAERVQKFVDEAPQRLQGGDAADALRAAATRGVAFLATGVLTLFFLLDGPRMAEAAAHQVHDPERRARAERVAVAAFRRSFGYARGSMAMAMMAGLLSWSVCRLAGVPGPAPLALWVALWDLVPLVGALIGAVPIVALAAIVSPERGWALVLVFVAYQLLEWLFVQRWIERRTIRVGPFATVVAGFAGLELYGVGGALVVLLTVTLVMATLDELLPPAEADGKGSGAVADGGQVGPVGVVEVDGRRALEHLAEDV
jgi:predicted PurR-regulated permease PerM